jgi:hypothetical protein
MKQIEDSTRVNGKDCIKFVPRTNEKSYIIIHDGQQGCSSDVGMLHTHEPQYVSLSAPRCIWPGLIGHELTHVIGFWHEIARPDRDQYLRIVYENIIPGMEYNFDIKSNNVTTLNSPYDYSSILQYDDSAFSSNGLPTIVPYKRGVSLKNSPLRRLSKTDISEIRTLYKCV